MTKTEIAPISTQDSIQDILSALESDPRYFDRPNEIIISVDGREYRYRKRFQADPTPKDLDRDLIDQLGKYDSYTITDRQR